MRVDPSEKIVKKDTVNTAVKLKTERIMRIIALIVAFVSVFGFMIKIMFL